MNRIKRLVSILLIFSLAIGLFMIPGESSVEAKAKKAVVIYFTGTGTTEKVAKKIKKATGGTLIKVKAKKPYTKKDLDWTNDNSRVCKEHNSAKSPAVSTVRPGISNLKKIKKAIKKADVVYIGYPIWWSEAPHIIYNLVEHVNIKGKTVVPFCTSQASGLGKSAKHLKGNAALNKTKWLSGKGWYEGSLPSQKKINKWVKQVTKKIKTAKAATSKPEKITTQEPSSLPQVTVTDNPSTDGGKTAVVYYSASGKTKARAQEVYQTLGSEQADLIEIVPEQVYTNDDLNWTNDNSRVSTEHNNTDADGRVSVRPELSAESKNVNLSEYKRIIIGYPIWWYDASWVTWSFLDYHRERLAGKTVIPFCTSASSSVDKSVETLKAMYPDMVINESDAIRLTSSNAASWAEGLKNKLMNNTVMGEMTVGNQVYEGFVLDNMLETDNEKIHFNLYVPDTYDGTEDYALFVTLPGWEGLYFQGVGTNLRFEKFGQEAVKYNKNMIVVAPQLDDWEDTSTEQTIKLVEYFLDAYRIDRSKIYINGYSGGGETLSLVLEKRPELFAAALHVSSKWDGSDYSKMIKNKTPLYFAIGESDSYYGSDPVKKAYKELKSKYEETGLSEEEINKVLVLDAKEQEYFTARGYTDQHGGGGAFAFDGEIMGWLFEDKEKICIPQTGYTKSVSEEYFKTSDKPGRVESLSYDSYDYAGTGERITKKAYVYLPNGYEEDDTEIKYDIIYLMHGWTGHAGEFFEYASIKEMLDNMIAKGDIPPVIAVSPSFYNDNSDTGFGGSVSEIRQFHKDFRENLMPAVEGKYHTYAEGTSEKELAAARNHRIFGGFSLGCVTTWLEFCYDYDYIRYFLPMSGSCWYYGGYGDFRFEQNVDFIENLVKEQKLDERGYFIYHAVGTADAVKSQSLDMADEMLKRDSFTPNHYVFYQKNGGQHDHFAVREYMYNALPIFFKEITGKENAINTANTTDKAVTYETYYTKETPIKDVAEDKAFGDYGRLIFPVNSGYMSGSTLGELSLTWYNYIDSEKTVEICNYMKNHAAIEDTIFYDIYTEEEKAADPAKRDTGLFFFKGNPGTKFAIVNAGGGFAYVGAMHDSFPHALELSKMGYNAFALIYRPGAQTACEDLSRAIAFIFEHAKELEVDTDGYSLWGGSAGGRMADWVGTYGTENFGEKAYPQPAAVIVNYTGLSEVTGYEPPTYSAVGTSDGIATWRTMKERLAAMSGMGIPTEFHSYEGLPHGFGLGTGTVAEGWIDDAVAFWEDQM